MKRIQSKITVLKNKLQLNPWVFLGLTFVLFFHPTKRVYGQNKTLQQCQQHFQQKDYLSSAQCFAKLANQYQPEKNAKEKEVKGRALRNAFIAYQRAAKKASSVPIQANFLLIQAKKQLEVYLKEVLCTIAEECKRVRMQKAGIETKLTWASLQIYAIHPRAQMTLFRAKRPWISPLSHKNTSQMLRVAQKVGSSWKSSRLIPGYYIIQVTYPTSSKLPSKRHIILLDKGKKVWSAPHIQFSLFTGNAQMTVIFKSPLLGSKTQTGAKIKLRLIPGSYQLTILRPNLPTEQRKLQIAKTPSKQQFGFINVDTFPQKSAIYLNEKYKGLSPQQIIAPLGSYRLKLQRACYLPSEKVLRLTPQGLSLEQVRLKRDPLWLKANQSAGSKKIASWVVLGGGVVVLIASGVFQGLALYWYNQTEDPQGVDLSDHSQKVLRIDSPLRYRTLIETGNTMRLTGHILAGSGAALVITGIILALLPKSSSSQVKCKVQHTKPVSQKPVSSSSYPKTLLLSCGTTGCQFSRASR